MGVKFNETVLEYSSDGERSIPLRDVLCRPSCARERVFNDLFMDQFVKRAFTNPLEWAWGDCGTYDGLGTKLRLENSISREYIYGEIRKILDSWKRRDIFILDFKGSVKLPYNFKVWGNRLLKNVLNMWLMRVVIGKYMGDNSEKYHYVASIIQKNIRGYLCRKV